MDKKYSINYTKVADAESLLFDAKKRIRGIDSPLPWEIWGVVEDNLIESED